MRVTAILMLALMAIAASAATAAACSIAGFVPNTLPVAERSLVVPVKHDGARASWRLPEGTWRSVRPDLNANVPVEGRPQRWGVTLRQATVLRFLAVHRHYGRVFADDDDAATPPCELAGQPTWSAPQLRVRQTPRAIFATFVVRATQGNRTGCVVTFATAINSCGDIALGTVRLNHPVGRRRVVLSRFA